MGRPRKPTALRVLQGNPGHRALPKHEPKPPPGKAQAPADLGVLARALWDEWAPVYEAMGVLTVADTRAFANWMRIEARISAGEKSGQPANGDMMRLAQSYAMQFGGTPASRAKVTVKVAEKKDEFGEMYGGG